MNMNNEAVEVIQRLSKQYNYYREAYLFTLEVIHLSSQKIKKSEGKPRHLSCGEFANEFVDFAKLKFGILADTVLEQWNVHTSKDIGILVFSLIESGMMSKNENDSLEQFDGLFEIKDVSRYDWKKDFDSGNIQYMHFTTGIKN